MLYMISRQKRNEPLEYATNSYENIVYEWGEMGDAEMLHMQEALDILESLIEHQDANDKSTYVYLVIPQGHGCAS